MGAYGEKDKQRFKADLEAIYTRFPRLAERRNQIAGTLSGGEQQIFGAGFGVGSGAGFGAGLGSDTGGVVLSSVPESFHRL